MNTRLCLKIASRMNAMLLRELGQGIDPARMVADPLYARDVLLVSDTFRDHDLARLAARFRAEAVDAPADTAASNGGGDSGFSASRFLNSIFGGASASDPPPRSETPPQPQGQPGRWRNDPNK